MVRSFWVVSIGSIVLLAGCGDGSDEQQGSSVQHGGTAAGGSAGAGSGGLSLPMGGGGAAAGSGAGTPPGGAGAGAASGTGGSGGAGGGSSGAGGSGGKPPSAPHPTALTIYFCLGDGCPFGSCSGGAVPSCNDVWGGPMTESSPLCDPAISGDYCLVTDGGVWRIECNGGESYNEKCPGNCANGPGGAYCN